MSRSAIIAFPILSLLCLHAPFSHGERIKLFRPCVGYGYLSLRADRITARMGAFAMDNELVEATTLVKDDIKCSSYDGDGKSVEVKAILHFNTTHPGVSFVLLGDFRVGAADDDHGWNTTSLSVVFSQNFGKDDKKVAFWTTFSAEELAALGWKSSVVGKGHACPKTTISLNTGNVLEVENLRLHPLVGKGNTFKGYEQCRMEMTNSTIQLKGLKG